MPRRSIAALAVVSLFLTACAATKIRSTRRAPDFHSAQIHRVMVVGLFKDPALRKHFEEEFVRQWKARGVDAVSGLEVLPSTAALYKVGIAPIAKTQGFDSVLIARVLERRTVRRGEVATAYASPESQSDVENLNTVMQVLLGPPVAASPFELATVETSLYNVATGVRFWSARSETKVTGKISERIPSFVRLLLERIYQTP